MWWFVSTGYHAVQWKQTPNEKLQMATIARQPVRLPVQFLAAPCTWKCSLEYLSPRLGGYHASNGRHAMNNS